MMDIQNKNEWALKSGLMPMHLMQDKSISRFIMLDGGVYDFCLDITGEKRAESFYMSEAWSSNAKNYIYVTPENITVYNWLMDSPESLSAKIVSEKFSRFLTILNENSYRTADDVTPFILNLFRKMRNQTKEKKGAVEALNLLYRLLIYIEEETVDSKTCKKWGIENVSEPLGFDLLIEQVKKGSRNIKPNLDLILQHCSGVIFQEAHREALQFDGQYDLFGNISSNIALKSSDRYSSIHYTPQYLARSIVEKAIECVDLQKQTIRILDPACGSGSFLIEVIKQLKENAYNGKIYVEGLDSSSCAISTTKFLMSYEQRVQWKENQMSFTVRCVADSLQEDWSSGYDIIMMNPPFLSMELIKDKQNKDAINDILSPINMKKRPNQAAAFLYKAVQGLTEDGVLGVVLPSSLLLLEQYIPLRNAIRKMAEIHVIGHLGNYVFEDALTDVSFVLIKKSQNHKLIPQTMWCGNGYHVAFDALKGWRKMSYSNSDSVIQKDYNIYTPSNFPVIRNSWKTVPQSDNVFIVKVNEWQSKQILVSLQDVFSIKQGLLEGCKDAFVIDKDNYDKLNKNEKKLFRPLASASTIESGIIQDGKYIWYPYDSNGLIVKTEESLQEYKNAIRLIERKKVELMKRKGVDNWWELTRPRNWQYEKQVSIVSKRFGNANSFAINLGDYVIEEGNALIFNKKNFNVDDYYFYLSILSSSTFERLLSIYARPLLAGYDLGKAQIKDIPVPRIDGFMRKSDHYKDLVYCGKSYSNGDIYKTHIINEKVRMMYPDE